MASHFDETDDYYEIADNTDVDFPDNVWTFLTWLKMPSNTGTLYKYWFSTGSFTANPSFNIYVNETSEASDQDNLNYALGDDDTTFAQDLSVATPGTNTGWQLVGLRRAASAVFHIVIDGVDEENITVATFDAITTSVTADIGRREDGDSNRYYGGEMACVCKWDSVVGTNQMAAMSRGANPFGLGITMDMFYPLIGDLASEPNWSGNHTVAARVDSTKFAGNPPVEMIENHL